MHEDLSIRRAVDHPRQSHVDPTSMTHRQNQYPYCNPKHPSLACAVVYDLVCSLRLPVPKTTALVV